MSKNDGSSKEVEDGSAKYNKLELQCQALALERDELLRSKKDREAKI